jgi:protein TonB
VSAPQDQEQVSVRAVVFEGATRSSSTAHWGVPLKPTLAWLIALSAHGLLALSLISAPPTLEAWGARAALLIHRDLQRALSDELNTLSPELITPSPAPKPVEPPPADPPPAPKPAEPLPIEPPSTRPPPRRRVTPPPPKTSPKLSQPSKSELPPQPAQAGGALTAQGEAGPGEAALITGDGARFAGGVSAREGGDEVGQKGAQAHPSTSPPPAPKVKRRPPRPARLISWRCAWPSSAQQADVFEASVTLQALINERGEALGVKVLSDPGFGLGKAATRCAREARFEPAHDNRGRPVRAVSPPIRVRFTR